jgi:UDP-glucose 4-epimerase
VGQPQGRRVLITGVSSPIAAALARRLEARDDVAYLAGLDSKPPAGLGRTEFIRADLRSPLVTKVVESTGVDTLVHAGLVAMTGEAGGRARMKEINVIGTMQLLAAAQKSARVRQVVVRSSTAVYGSSYRNPSLLAEDAPVAPAASGYAKDAAELEGYARGLARRRGDISVTILRLASTVGPTVQTPLTKYFSLPVLPTVLGYDPRLQFLHEDDAVGVFEEAVSEGHPGIFNVAGSGALYLSQAIRLCGKPSVPVVRALMPWVAGALRRTGPVDFSADQLPFLMHGRVADTSRLRRQFAFAPRYDTRQAFEAFLAARDVEPIIDPAAIAAFEQWALRRLTGERSRTA